MTQDPNSSPDFFSASPSKGRGVRRLNNMPLIGVSIIALMAVIGVSYTLIQKQNKSLIVQEEKDTLATVDLAPMPIQPVGNDYISAALPAKSPPELPKQENQTSLPVNSSFSEIDELTDRKQQFLLRIEEKRLAQMEAALSADSAVSTASAKFDTDNQNEPRPTFESLTKQLYGDAGLPGMNSNSGIMAGSNDPNLQNQKIAFLSGTPEADVYLKATRQDAISASLELKAGTIIPGVMISGINSDLPGQIIGQVKESVYDSATGQNVLVPVGARLIGQYDSRVALGQKRALITWQRIIYPDGSSLSIGNMPGTDQAGYAGFKDKVDNHYARIFGSSLMLSVISAAAQLSQPNNNKNSDRLSSQEILAAELGRQWGDVGAQMTNRNLQIQPTIEIRPGYNFNIMVTKDIILSPWQGHPMALQTP